MRTPDNMLQAALKLDLHHEILNALYDAAPEFVTAQKEQLMAGRRNDDKTIFNVKTGSEEYSESYAKVKGKKGPIDLHRTGDWQNGIFIDPREDQIYIASTDPKDEMLNTTYSEQILGLGPKAKEDFIPKLQGIFVENITKKLNR